MTVTITATAEPAHSPPRVRLDVVSNVGPNNTVILYRIDPDGRTVLVRTPDGGPVLLTTSGSVYAGVAYDYEAPYGHTLIYTNVGDDQDPQTASNPVVLPATQTWLIHPGVPDLSAPVTIAEFGARERKANRGVFTPMGRATAVVVSDGQRKAAEYAMTVFTPSESTAIIVETLLDDLSPLLLSTPGDRGYGIGRFGSEYVSIGDVSEARIVRFAGNPARMWSFTCTVVERPVGGSTADRTYTDLFAYASYADLAAAYPTYFDLLAGP